MPYKYWRKQSLNVKILFPVIIIQGFLTLMLIFLLMYLRFARDVIETNNERVQKVNELTSYVYDLEKQIDVDILSYRFNKNVSTLGLISQHTTRMNTALEEMDKYLQTGSGRDIKRNFEMSREGSIETRDNLIKAIQNGSEIEINRNYQKWLLKTQNINAALQDLTNYNLNTLKQSTQIHQLTMLSVYRTAVITMVSTLLLIVVLFLYLRNVVAKPIQQLSRIASRISEGHFGDRLELSSDDEIGELAKNINKMALSLQANYHRLEKEIKEKEEALLKGRELERRKDDFISMASHELKTPVTSIKVFTQILEKYNKEKGDVQDLKYLTRMSDQIDRLTKIINELLDVSRIQSRRLELSKELVSPSQIIEEACENIQATVPSHKILFRKTDVKPVFIDKYRINQVLVNLLTNAVKYSPSGGEILLKLEENPGEVVVSVKDHGIGISKEYHDRIFERFYRVYDKNEKTFPGLGMGLYISSEIVKKHKGRIWFEREEGKGSTFYFSLPKAAK